jgi:type I restriction enzyme R subunit
MLGNTFDPDGDVLISENCRPHWSQSGTVVFITFRTHDSIPRDVIRRWDREKYAWLQQHGYQTDSHWSTAVPTLSPKDREQFHKQFNRCREECLDTCHGRCLLKRAELSQIAADSLLYFDRQRYRLGDFVVMPNHVHLLAVFGSPELMRDQCDSWMHFTAFRIHQFIGEKGKFWQQEVFDHLVRNPEQYDYLRKYIADNPQKAKLKPGEYHYRRFDG